MPQTISATVPQNDFISMFDHAMDDFTIKSTPPQRVKDYFERDYSDPQVRTIIANNVKSQGSYRAKNLLFKEFIYFHPDNNEFNIAKLIGVDYFIGDNQPLYIYEDDNQIYGEEFLATVCHIEADLLQNFRTIAPVLGIDLNLLGETVNMRTTANRLQSVCIVGFDYDSYKRYFVVKSQLGNIYRIAPYDLFKTDSVTPIGGCLCQKMNELFMNGDIRRQ